MKIVAPLSSRSELNRLIDAGADEIYCGVCFDGWQDEFGGRESSNARHFSSNLRSMAELESVIKEAHSRNAKIKIALNESFSWSQYSSVAENVERIVSCHPDEIIVSDMGLICRLSKTLPPHIQLAVSTMAAAFNSRAVEMYARMGVGRVILPRQMSLEEIKAVTSRFPELEFESIVLNSKCKGICGFCSFDHCVGFGRLQWLLKIVRGLGVDRLIPHQFSELMRGRMERRFYGCCLDYKVSPAGEESGKVKKLFDRSLDASGAYALQALSASGVGFVKIAGREFTSARKVRDIKFMRSVIDLINLPESEFLSIVSSLHRKFGYKINCADNLYFNVGPEGAIK